MSSWNFFAVNAKDHLIRHRDLLGELTRMDDDVNDFAFALVNRNPHQVAFRSVSLPDRYLRHRDFRIHLDQQPAQYDELFAADSTFHFERGLADPAAFSFRSVNFPDRYLRHRDFHLFVEPPAGPHDDVFAHDATFTYRAAAVLIDDN